MKKRFVSILMMALLVMSLALTACTKSAPAPKATDAVADADATVIEQVAADYIATEFGQYYDKADASIPTVYIIRAEVADNGDVTAYGDFWLENYEIKGDTLEFVSGGNEPGVMHMKKVGDSYKVTKFDQVEDGSNYTDSAKKLFGEYYDAFAKYTSDDKAKAATRGQQIANYVKANGLKVTQYHDFGWDPVALPTN